MSRHPSHYTPGVYSELMSTATRTGSETAMTRREVEVDRQLAELGSQIAQLEATIESIDDSWHYALNENKIGYGRAAHWPTTDTEARAKIIERLAAGAVMAHEADRLSAKLTRRAQVRAEITELIERQRPLHAEYVAAGRWSRFFLVEAGHIHRSTYCSTCRPTTRFGWLTDLSGLTEADAVAAHGALLCTVCYPTAPVEWTNGRELEAAAKADGKCPGRRDYDAPSRTGYVSGNWATCDTCHGHITITSTGKLRSHKAAQ